MKNKNSKLAIHAVAAIALVSILTGGIAEAGGRPGSRDADADTIDRATLIQTTPMQKPPAYDPYVPPTDESLLCRLVRNSFLRERFAVSLLACSALEIQTLDQQDDSLQVVKQL